MMIRQATVNDWKGIAKVQVDSMREAYKNHFPAKVIDNMNYLDRENRWQNDLPKTISGGTMNYVVVNEKDIIIGFALGGTMRDPRLRIKYTGELYGIYLVPELQGQGFGKKLLESVAYHLASQHHNSMALWTLKPHNSCFFFERMQGKEVYEKNTMIGGKELKECAYGWDDVQSILSETNHLN
ncbi:GCN5-related N-acetyltransferase [Evansella cellulosilytica DSM 2522]|uniref:GCN5-related N-acetyltransferase n=2 Tax=Evansella TaxID=2837485 RepID=E6TR80_EVAC2|nr:GCN5-related N-acetyltransferase [Evansella cellulosilytica DSM 2522]